VTADWEDASEVVFGREGDALSRAISAIDIAAGAIPVCRTAVDPIANFLAVTKRDNFT
jgi:hypothetical protein